MGHLTPENVKSGRMKPHRWGLREDKGKSKRVKKKKAEKPLTVLTTIHSEYGTWGNSKEGLRRFGEFSFRSDLRKKQRTVNFPNNSKRAMKSSNSYGGEVCTKAKE